jgi:DNA repair photolyase
MNNINQKQNNAEKDKNHIGVNYSCSQILDRVPAYDEQSIVNEVCNQRFLGWDKMKIIDDFGVERDAIAPVIISATWRSDIPAWHGDWFMERLRRGHMLSTYRQRKYVSFDNTRVIVFWTKNPAPMFKHLDELDQMGINYYFHYTLTDYEQDGLEPNITPLVDRITTFKQLSNRLGKDRIIWRFDPLVLTDTIDRERLVCKVANLIERLAGFTEKLVISFLDPVERKKVERQLIRAGICAKRFSFQDVEYVSRSVADYAERAGIKVAACAEAMDLISYGIQKNKCIDDEYLRRVFRDDKALMSFLGIVAGVKNQGQRKLCGCIPSFDIGTYNTCKNGCVYCYANTSQKAVANNFKRLSSYGETLLLQ